MTGAVVPVLLAAILGVNGFIAAKVWALAEFMARVDQRVLQLEKTP